MKYPSDVLDCVGFLRSDVMPLLENLGVSGDGQPLSRYSEATDWPDWKVRLSVSEYITDGEAAAALAGVDIFAPGFLSDDERAELSHWQTVIERACLARSLTAMATDTDKDGRPCAWQIKPIDLAAWCRTRPVPVPYPLPGEMAAKLPSTDEGLRDALAASERERAEWKAKAEAIEVASDQLQSSHQEIASLRESLRAKEEELAKLTVERDELKTMVLSGKSRNTALKIIGGLAKEAYRIDIHAVRLEGIGELVGDLEKAGAGLTEKTVREWLKEAAAALDRESKKL